MAQVCPHCGTSNRDTARFCSGCGYRLTAALAPGDVLQSRYRIVRLLGRGGMGAVYQAEDLRIVGKLWAIKEMSDAGLTDPLDKQRAIEAFRREAQLLGTLDHPNLPKIGDFFTEAGKHYLVMEFVPGETLENRMARQGTPCSEAEVRAWALQLCDVLEYLHSQQPPVIFRDLKPGNIMITPQGQLKLIDFGIARLFKPGKAYDTTLLGTAGYAPPEQYGKGQTDARSDIYALGATLHHLLTKYDPAQGGAFQFPSIRSLNPNVSEALERAIEKALALDPKRRWQSVREMREALQSLQPATVPGSKPLSGPRASPSAPSVRRVSSPAASAAAILVNVHHLDFGTILPGRIRWIPLVVDNQSKPTVLRISSDQPWIEVAPTAVKLRPGERRTVAIGVNASRLAADTGQQEKGHIKLASDTSESRVSVAVKVVSVSGLHHIAILLTNLALGAILGLLLIGVLGNLLLMLFDRGTQSALLGWGAGCGAIILALAGLKVQDTVNLALSLGIGILVSSSLGALLGALLGFLANLIADGSIVISVGVGIGLLVGTALGMAYVCNSPIRWKPWPF